MKNPNKVPAIFLLVFGSIFLVSGIIQFIINSDLENNGVPANGIVTKMQSRSSSRSKTTYVPIISYKAKDGREYELRSNIFYDDPDRFKKGDVIQVLYDPKQPEKATLANENEALVPLVMGGGFGLLMCIGGIMIYRKGKKKMAETITQAT
ncbi:MAG: DUF3592 domain-containing protein [Bacteroidia bacterium]